eukprot:jgi/Bigna1/142795/aug1.73_g17503
MLFLTSASGAGIENKSDSGGGSADEEETRGAVDESLPDELDFFGENRRADATSKKKKKEINREGEEENLGEDDDDDDDGKEMGGGEGIVTQNDPNGARRMKALRKRLGLHVKGTDIPDAITSFNELETRYKVPKYLLNNLREAKPHGFGFGGPTPIQSQAIPCLLSRQDVSWL